jgi:ABC-2 type transport system permease protein
MSSITVGRTEPVAPSADHELHPPKGLVHDMWVIAKRGLTHMRRQPEQLTDATIQPVMFVVLFAYVFGGAIAVPGGGSYRQFLMGGIFAQTIVFSAFGVAMSLANDRKNQALDRFRSLPIAKGAILGGHAVASVLKALLPIVIMSVVGYLVGWRINGSIAEAAFAYFIMISFAFAMVWIGVLIGSLVRTPEGVTGVAFVVLFPISFIASTFVPVTTMPGPIRAIAERSPVSTLADSTRQLFGNPYTPAGPDSPWPMANPQLYTLLWVAGVVAVCAPLAVRAYARSIDS